MSAATDDDLDSFDLLDLDLDVDIDLDLDELVDVDLDIDLDEMVDDDVENDLEELVDVGIGVDELGEVVGNPEFDFDAEFGPGFVLKRQLQVKSILDELDELDVLDGLDELDVLDRLDELDGLGLDPPAAFDLIPCLASPVCRSTPVDMSWGPGGEVTPSPPAQHTSDAYFPPMPPPDLERLAIPDVGVTRPLSPMHPKPEPFEATEPSHLENLWRIVNAHSQVSSPAQSKPRAVEPVPTSDLRCRVKACLRNGGERIVQQVIQEVRSSAPPFVVPESCRIYMDRPEKWVLVGRCGPRHYGHPGNYYFRVVLAPHFRDLYEVVSKNQKAAVADAMVDTIRDLDGQFVEYDETHGWVQVTDAVAREKASMTLRTKPSTAEERRAKRLRYK